MRLGDRLYASSPELCFVQMATVLPFVELVKLGFELCGTYAERLDGATRYDRPLLLTSVAALARFVDSAGDIPGVVAARKAVKLLVACSASPRETALTMLLCLPLRRGGYGLPSPELNFRIDVGRSKRAVTDKGYYLCDLYWREACIDLEYESDERHTGAERIAEDSTPRRSACGYGSSRDARLPVARFGRRSCGPLRPAGRSTGATAAPAARAASQAPKFGKFATMWLSLCENSETNQVRDLETC